MTHVNVQAARAHLSELLDLVEQGEQIAIFRGDRTVAKLVAHRQYPRNYRSVVGIWHGKADISRFDEVDDEMADKLEMLG